MRDAFIAGMTSVLIRQRLLENRELTFHQAYEQARAQEMAYRNAETFGEDTTCRNTFLKETLLSDDDVDSNSLKTSLPLKKTCYFCGQPIHSRFTCPARNAICNYCNKIGHYYKVCRKHLSNHRPQNSGPKSSAISGPTLAIVSASVSHNLLKVLCDVTVDGIPAKSLMGTGSLDCYIDKDFADTHCFGIKPISGEVTLAETSVRMPISGQCTATLVLKGNNYT